MTASQQSEIQASHYSARHIPDPMQVMLPDAGHKHLPLVDPLVTLLGMGYTTGTQLKALFNYIVQYGDAPRFREFLSQLADRLPQHKEELMTIAERLHEEGRQKGHFLGRQEGLEQGLEQGLQEGLQQGKHAEALRIARAMLENGLDRETVVKMTGLSVDEIMAVSH